MKRNYLLATGLTLIVLVSALTVIWLSPLQIQDSVILRSYNSLPDAVRGILGGQVEMLPIDKISLEALEPLENSTQVKLVSIPSYDFTYIGLNLRNSPLNDAKFREAMLLAFNRPRMLNKSLGSFGRGLGPGLFSSAYSTIGWPIVNDQYGYNPGMAKLLLDSEGFNETSSSYRIDPSTNQTLRLMTIISRLTQPQEVAAAASFAEDMQSIGLPIVSLPMSSIDFNEALRTYTFDIFIDSQAANAAPTWLYTLFDSKNDVSPVPLSTNLVGFRNSTYDEYATQLLASNNPEEIRTAAEKCQEILAAELPVLPVFSENFLIVANPRLPVNQVIGSIGETVRSTVINLLKDQAFSPPLRIGVTSDFGSLDPTVSSNQADWIALSLLTEPLASTDQQGGLKPALAQGWTVSDDGTVITVVIRQNATFCNGQRITVDDVVDTMNWLIKNTKPSSPLYTIMMEIKRADTLDQKTLRIELTQPDRFAANAFTTLFALPASRLSSDPSGSDSVVSQLLVSSGPLILREFTQTDGVSMQLNSLYFGEPLRNLENINAFQGDTIQGIQLFSGSLITISSQPLVIETQAVANASYRVCIYDQNGVRTECASGNYVNQGTYSVLFPIDARFHQGTYWVESAVYGNLPNGTFIILNEKTMTVRGSPLIPLIIFALLILGVGIIVGRWTSKRSRVRKRRRARRVRTVRRAGQSRRVRGVSKRT
ncbi:MAG: ABC transporter substrate-binding protein [Candidatus Bathyarchaeia archaeon]